MGICSFEGCDKALFARSLCNSHYAQQLRGKSLTAIDNPHLPAGIHVPDGQCWCRQCRQVLPYAAFMPKHTKPGRRAGTCKACIKRQRPTRPKKRRPQDLQLPDGHRWCASCETVKPIDGFHRKSSYCKPCHLASNRRSLYGIGRDEYEALWQTQGGACAICGSPCRRNPDVLCVDHDHQTGAVRGLLCSLCNTGLGAFEDDAIRLSAAIKYLESRRAV